MASYIIKRLLLFIPTLLVISLVAFGLSKLAPDDPVIQYLVGSGNADANESPLRDRTYIEVRRKLGVDKPVFYFAVRPKAYPDTLYRLLTQQEQLAAKKWIAMTGDWSLVNQYQDRIQLSYEKSVSIPDSLGVESLTRIRRRLRDLAYVTDTSVLRKRMELHKVEIAVANLETAMNPEQDLLLETYESLMTTRNKKALLRPKFVWYGWDNQYHNWISGLLSGDFGYSFRDGLPVGDKVKHALSWTFWLNALALLIAYGLSVFLGVLMARNKGKGLDRGLSLGLFILYSLPSFWIATLLLIFFGTPDYHIQFFSITELSRLDYNAPFWSRFGTVARHMVLPVFCLTYVPIAAISLQMRGGMVEALRQDYIRTAYAKGLPKSRVIWKHAFRNGLFPIITILGALFPATIAGSVVIEKIFNIPGMGRLMIESISEKDWPVVYIIMLLSALLTMAGILISDLLYAVADPRVRLNKKES
jgi:peptide/nickel transport system permease protein